MGLELLENMNDRDAAKLMELVRGRLSYNDGRIGAALLEVLEVDLPEGIDPLEFESTVLGSAVETVSDSYADES